MEQQTYTEFLPISRADMEARGWDQLDFVVVGGDAYVDHPSFGTAIISRLLEAEGYKIGVLAQPRYTDCEDFKRFGKPKYGFFIGGGNVDSMVSHYSVAKIPRAEDEYSPGGKGGARPDRSATVYTKLAKEAYPDLPVILGGLEASLRRFAHYDYWLDTVLPSIAEDSGADIISYGMGEHQTVEIARRLAAGEPVESITDVDGTCYLTDFDHLPERYVECAGFKKWPATRRPTPRPAASRWTIRMWSAARSSSRSRAKNIWCRTSRPSPLSAGSWIKSTPCPTPAVTIPFMKTWAVCLPSGRCSSPSSRTAAVLAAATSAPSSSIRAAVSPAAARTASWPRRSG